MIGGLETAAPSSLRGCKFERQCPVPPSKSTVNLILEAHCKLPRANQAPRFFVIFRSLFTLTGPPRYLNPPFLISRSLNFHPPPITLLPLTSRKLTLLIAGGRLIQGTVMKDKGELLEPIAIEELELVDFGDATIETRQISPFGQNPDSTYGLGWAGGR